MHRVGKFEKVSFSQFHDAMMDGVVKLYKDAEEIEKDIKEAYEAVTLPSRATKGSAGYDIVSPISFILAAQETIKIPTGLRVKVKNGWFLGIVPRSSLGFKYRLQLDNSFAVVDSDYYYSDNEGHIFLKLTNDSNQRKVLNVTAGDKIAQAIFLPFGVTIDDKAVGLRNGGMGSTGK